jgi:glutamate synthase (NADPH/NADH) small chain
MGKPTGFIEWQRILPKKRPVAERVRDSREVEDVHGPLEHDSLRNQAGRCMDCGIPFCTQGCPLGNPIPDFNRSGLEGSLARRAQATRGDERLPRIHGAVVSRRPARPRACSASTARR